jgi:hypothetical protein
MTGTKRAARTAMLGVLVGGMLLISGCSGGSTPSAAGSVAPPSASSSPSSPSSPTSATPRPATSVTRPAENATPAPRNIDLCVVLAPDQIKKELGVTVTNTLPMLGSQGCSWYATTGSHDAPDAQMYLAHHDGVYYYIEDGALEGNSSCAQSRIPGIPSTAYVCRAKGGATVASFKLKGKKDVGVVMYTKKPPPLHNVDVLVLDVYQALAGSNWD